MTDKSFDLCVVGGGIFGLQLARQALLSGLSVCLVEERNIGSGSSGGVLGALMPHIPDRWDAKKQFQFEALTDLEGECESLEAETGLSTGYGRIGRIMPLREENFVKQIDVRAAGAKKYWADSDCTFERAEFDPNWLDSGVAKFGCVKDSFAARLNPRGYLTSLARFVSDHKNGLIIEGVVFTPEHHRAKSIDVPHGSVKFDQAVLCAGFKTFPVLEALIGQNIGGGVKGQARLVALDMPSGTPVLYDDGCYIVPHENGTVAVGSTSDKIWQDEHIPDQDNWGFFDRALALCPAIRSAEIIAEWAGVRPKCRRIEPVVGKVPQIDDLFAFTGGFKISFGIAHHAAKALVTDIKGEASVVQLPETFTSEHHFGA